MKSKLEVVRKWSKMLSGKSVFHMRQLAGRYYEKDSVQGYYSDLRHKVTGNTLLDIEGVPINITNHGSRIYFTITIFQYGLGAYDLYLETGDKQYLEKFNISVSWAMRNQEVSGGWDAFSFKNKEVKYSSMAQGEGVSLLVRAFIETREQKYIIAAKKALDFMLLPVEEGGTTLYNSNGGFTFEESSDYRTILNGVIFSIWGLWDYVLLTNDKNYSEILHDATKHLASMLPMFDCGYWSNYDLDGNITSPFYHDLHIEQLKVMFDLFEIDEFNVYKEKWLGYQNSPIKTKKAFVVKAVQKLKNSNTNVVLVR